MDAAGAVALDYDGARYSRVAIWLHWTIAIVLLANMILGYTRGYFDPSLRPVAMNLHKSLGFTVLVLTCVRLAWRFSRRPPAFDSVMKPWEVTIARGVHGLFYVLLIALPLSGWLSVSTSGRSNPTNVLWSGLRIGRLPVHPSEWLDELADQIHLYLGYVTLFLVLMHVAGAIKHHLEGHRQLLGRMAPILYRSRFR